MKRAFFLTPIALVALVLWGCAKALTAQDLAGNWEGAIEIPDADLLKQLKAMGKSEKDLPEMRKELESKGKFPMELGKDMTFTFGAGAGAASGTWKFESPKVTLTIDKAQGMSVEQIIKLRPDMKDEFRPMVWTVSKDGSTISGALPNPGGPNVSVKFSRPAKQ